MAFEDIHISGFKGVDGITHSTLPNPDPGKISGKQCVDFCSNFIRFLHI